VAKNLSAPVAVPSHILQGQGGSLQNAAHRGGVQAIDDTLTPAYMQVDTRGVQPQLAPDPTLGYDVSGFSGEASAPAAQLAPNSFLGPDAQERNAQLSAAARTTKAHGYI
jgi:hypothetical protein